MTGSHYDVVIAGAGHAGAQTAIALRQLRFEGSIALVGEEPELPYERPPLTKAYLSQEKSFDRILIRPASFWHDRDIEMVLGEAITTVDPVRRCVTMRGGRKIGYGQLVWACGGHARQLACAGHGVRGVHTLRSRGDLDLLLAELPGAEDVVVIGGGYIGLEAAAVLTKLGKRVTVVEALDRVLSRVAGEPLSRFFEREHRAHGVVINLNAVIDRVEEADGAVAAVHLADGTRLPASIVIAGIGILPAVEPLLAAGARGGNGVAVDPHCRTSLPHIYAVGDCALHVNDFAAAAEIRLESVQNAVDQAMVAARNITGEVARYTSVPWFWSDQYDLKLQTVGLSQGFDAIVLRGDVAARSFSIIYLREGAVIALDCVNNARDFVQGKALVAMGAQIDPKLLAEVATPLKEFAQGRNS